MTTTPRMTAPPSGLIEKPRVASIDIMRGIVMVIMALDHTRDFFHADTALFDPTDLTKTHPFLFFTRWITHFCAPTFVFLSGISASITRTRKSKKELSLFLLTRGLWLIVLELTIIRFGLVFNLYYDFIILQVIWVIGASMVVLSALIYLPLRAILTVGLILVFGHNLFDLVPVQSGEPMFPIWVILRQAGSVTLSSESFLFVPYPLLPWLGIMTTGYGLGFLYDKEFDQEKRKKILLQIGTGAVALFILLRAFNLYGDPSNWSEQKNILFSIMSFVNVTKYPVSLLYTLLLLGPVLILLAWMENLRPKKLEPFRIIGRVPLFYYIIHFYLIHIAGLSANLIAQNISWTSLDFHFNKGFGGIPPGIGFSLGWVYVAWILIVVALYPLCKWYYRYRNQHNYWWLSYL
jgi:uncharacterized membrane protein